MASFSLGCYTVRVTDKSTGERLPLGGFVRGSDLMTVFHQYLQARVADYSIDHERQKLWRVLRPNVTNSTVNGIVETGEYGYTADLYNVDSETVSYQRIGTDAEMMPFYFLTRLPAHRNEGVVLLQRRSNLGIRTIFLKDFAEYFEESYPGFKAGIQPSRAPAIDRRISTERKTHQNQVHPVWIALGLVRRIRHWRTCRDRRDGRDGVLGREEDRASHC